MEAEAEPAPRTRGPTLQHQARHGRTPQGRRPSPSGSRGPPRHRSQGTRRPDCRTGPSSRSPRSPAQGAARCREWWWERRWVRWRALLLVRPWAMVAVVAVPKVAAVVVMVAMVAVGTGIVVAAVVVGMVAVVTAAAVVVATEEEVVVATEVEVVVATEEEAVAAMEANVVAAKEEEEATLVATWRLWVRR